MNGTNRHPVDELADIRAQIRWLKEREDVLRLAIIDQADEDGLLCGDQYEAQIGLTISERVDILRLRCELGHDFLRPFLVGSDVKTVRIKPRQELLGDPS